MREAETNYDLFLTVDKNIPHQQSIKERNLIVAVLNLPNQRLEGYAACLRNLAPMLEVLTPGRFYLIEPDRE